MEAAKPSSAGPPDRRNEDEEADPPAEVLPGSFARSVRSEGVDRPPSIHEVETHREHIRLNLENWEKQWADVLRYERAKVKDDADSATLKRALTRSGASLAVAISLYVPLVTDGPALEQGELGSLSIRDLVLVGGTASAFLCLASVWYAVHVELARRRFR